MFIDQKMNFAPLFAPISRVFARFLTAQRRRAHFAVDRLPFPANLSLRLIGQHQVTQHLCKNTLGLPGLKPFVDHTTGYAKPMSVNRLPLAACPKYIPDPVQRGPVAGTWTPRASSHWAGWQK